MNEQHKNEPSKTVAPTKSGAKPIDAKEHPAKKPLDGAGKPGDPPVRPDPSKPAKQAPANPDAQPANSKA